MLPENDITVPPHEQLPPPSGHGATPPSPPEESPRPPIHPDVLVRAGIGLGLVMVAMAVAWVNLFRRGDIWQMLRPPDAWQLLPGLLAGSLFAGVIWALGHRLEATRQIVALLERSLDLNAIELRHVVVFSLLAAFPEELLFRGALQPEVGLVMAAVVFGALHALTRLYFLYATCAGLLLGVLYHLGGTLWMPIGAHFAVDLVMFFLLLQRHHHFID